MRLQEKLAERRVEQKAILAVNFYNLETLKGILEAARSGEHPVILQLTESSINYIGMTAAVGLARQLLRDFEVEGWLHLDHGLSERLVNEALDAGFDSVMIDASEEPFDQNVAVTRRVVERAGHYDACVEAELGFVAKLGQSSKQTGFTQPAEARRFVDATGVNALAVAIGTSHGFYRGEPRLRLELLDAIRSATSCPLVLHGSSGLSDSVIAEAICKGICKVNLATELKYAFASSLREEFSQSDEIDPRKLFPNAVDAVSVILARKFRLMERELEVESLAAKRSS